MGREGERGRVMRRGWGGGGKAKHRMTEW